MKIKNREMFLESLDDDIDPEFVRMKKDLLKGFEDIFKTEDKVREYSMSDIAYIQEAKKAMKNFKQMVKEGMEKLSKSEYINASPVLTNFTEHIKEVSSKLNYRMLPLKK